MAYGAASAEIKHCNVTSQWEPDSLVNLLFEAKSSFTPSGQGKNQAKRRNSH